MEPANVVMMKGGPHAGSGWDAIVDWKIGDLRAAGITFWGYGGSVCHPTRQVQPFADAAGGRVEVAMIPTGSDPGNPATVAQEWSADGQQWNPLPEGVRVTGSKWALVMDQLSACEDSIDLGRYTVAVGASTGRLAADYLRARVDKGCFRLTATDEPAAQPVPVVLHGRLAAPWAVFLR